MFLADSPSTVTLPESLILPSTLCQLDSFLWFWQTSPTKHSNWKKDFVFSKKELNSLATGSSRSIHDGDAAIALRGCQPESDWGMSLGLKNHSQIYISPLHGLWGNLHQRAPFTNALFFILWGNLSLENWSCLYSFCQMRRFSPIRTDSRRLSLWRLLQCATQVCFCRIRTSRWNLGRECFAVSCSMHPIYLFENIQQWNTPAKPSIVKAGVLPTEQRAKFALISWLDYHAVREVLMIAISTSKLGCCRRRNGCV